MDPTNLTNIYFCDKPPTTELWKNYTYVHPAVSINTHNVCHGRGMIATRDICAGECIFVTPPTVYVDARDVQREFLKRDLVSSCSAVNLEEIAVEMLVENMWNRIVENDKGTINSFLVLMGSSSSGSGSSITTITSNRRSSATMKEVVWEKSDDCFRVTDTATLLGNNSAEYWSREELLVEKLVSRDDLKNIIFKNGTCVNCIVLDASRKKMYCIT